MSQDILAPTVVMFGPDLSAHGGVAAVASVLCGEATLQRFNVQYVSTWTEGGRYLRMRAFIRALLFAARLQSGTIVHVHMASRGSFLRKGLIVLVAHARGARTVLHLHGAEFHKFAARSGAFVRRAIGCVFNTADMILVLSPVWSERTEKFSGRSDAVVVPNPVELPAISAHMSGPRRVVFSGRLGERKGTPELLRAIAVLQGRGLSDVEWILAGDGEVERFRRVADNLPRADKVRFTGWLPHTDLMQLLFDAWVFCLPSHDEGKPVALLEAMACGLACVATPVGGVPDLVRSGATGLLVPVGDDLSLAEILEELLSSREKCLELGSNARELVAKEYASTTVGVILGGIYDELVSSTGVGGESVDCRAARGRSE